MLDPEHFSATYRGKSCDLGNTLEFHFLNRLNQRPGCYVTHAALIQDVWGERAATSNCLHRVVLKLRRRLTGAVPGVVIDALKENYRVVLS